MGMNWVITEGSWHTTVSLSKGYIWRLSLELHSGYLVDNFENKFKKNTTSGKPHKFDNSHADLNAFSYLDEFKGHSLLQAAREADVTRIKKHLSLEMVNFKHPQTHETALVMFQI